MARGSYSNEYSAVTTAIDTGATPIQIPKQPANTRISASLISSNNAANTINVRVWSHGYTAITPL